jgi:hypothetical protein
MINEIEEKNMKLDDLKKHLQEGQVYRREDLAKWSKSVDRHLDLLVKEGTMQKLSQGLYYVPEQTIFGQTPPNEEILIRSFLKDDRFLITSSNAYNGLGVGTTQLYNQQTVYNHKRHGQFKLGNRHFNFRIKPHFPKKLTQEFLLVDLVNNLDSLAEDREAVLRNVFSKAITMEQEKLYYSVVEYGSNKTKKILAPLLNETKL